MLNIINYNYPGVRDYIHVMDLATGHVAALTLLYRKHQHLKASVFRYVFLLLYALVLISFSITTFSIKTVPHNLKDL